MDNRKPSLLGACLEKQLGESLEAHAAEVIILARILGAEKAGEALGTQLGGKPFKRKPIRTIVDKVESGELPVTVDELKKVAETDPATKAFLERNPWLIDPTGKSVPKQRGRKPKGRIRASVPWVPQSAPPVQPPHQPAKPAPTQEVVAPKKDEEPDWKELSRLEEEHSRRLPEKKVVRTPPQFRGTPPPPVTATEEEREIWRALNKIEIADFIVNALTLGWEIPEGWDGLIGVTKVAK